MPSMLHEALVELFHRDPALAPELLAGPLRVELPVWQRARLDSADLTDRNPAEGRADTVIALTAAGTTVAGLMVEVQLSRDPQKRRSWPACVANLHRRLGRDAILLVVSPRQSIAAWCAKPIKLGHPGYVFTPLVLSPDQVPLVGDPDQAQRHPELAVLSAMAHGAGPQQERALRALLDGLRAVDPDHVSLYTDVVMAVLPQAARRCLEALMNLATYEPISPYFRRLSRKARAEGLQEGRQEGRAEGEATAVLEVLAARGITVPAEARDRITTCTDLRQLKTWIRRAVTATSVDDLFA